MLSVPPGSRSAVNERAEPAIDQSENHHVNIRCRLRTDSTIDKIGKGKPCSYLIRARRADPESELCVTETNSTHSCPAAARKERNATDSSVGPVYTRAKLKDLVQRLQECQAVESAQDEDSASEESSTTPDPKASRPVRESAQVGRYIFAPSLQPQRAPPATASTSSKRVARDAPVKAKRAKSKIRRRSAPAWSATSTSRSVPSHKPRSSGPTASRCVTSNSGARDPAPLFAKPLRTGGPSTVFLQKTPKQTSLASTPSAPPLGTSPSTQSGPIRQFLGGTSLLPVQRDVLAHALESAGVREAEDLVKVLFFHDDILKAFGDQLLVGRVESWPADSRFRTINKALQAVVEGARVEAKLGKSS